MNRFVVSLAVSTPDTSLVDRIRPWSISDTAPVHGKYVPGQYMAATSNVQEATGAAVKEVLDISTEQCPQHFSTLITMACFAARSRHFNGTVSYALQLYKSLILLLDSFAMTSITIASTAIITSTDT